MTLKALGEDALVAKLVRLLPSAPSVIVGPGDDCAVVENGSSGRHEVLKTDCIVEGVHFLPKDKPESVGWKALARNVSDFAAMGAAQPQHALVTLVVPGDRSLEWVEGLYRGLARCAQQFGIAMVGGETSRSAEATCLISVCLVGEIPAGRLVLRSTAEPYQSIYVTGTLGGSLKGKHLDFVPRLEEATWLANHFQPSAMMDLSDGLAKDLPRLAQSSGVGYQLQMDRVPCTKGCSLEQALGDGEDYELLFTLIDAQAGSLEVAWQEHFPDLKLTRIGRTVREEESEPLEGGWDHFQDSSEDSP